MAETTTIRVSRDTHARVTRLAAARHETIDATVRREQLARGRVMPLASGSARFYSPEDIVVQKLRWFRMGGEVSDQQWRDVLGVIRVSRDMDSAYLDRTAEAFGVRDLLDRARHDAFK